MVAPRLPFATACGVGVTAVVYDYAGEHDVRTLVVWTVAGAAVTYAVLAVRDGRASR